MFTAQGQVLGTLEYMSPEQANLNELDVDNRLHVPADALAEQFWVVTVVAEHLRLVVVTARKNANLDSRNDKLKMDDGWLD